MKIEELQQITNNFIEEIEMAKEGRTSSLPFIVHTLPSQPLVSEKEHFQTLIIGGSVYQSAICSYTGTTLTIHSRTNGLKPMFNSRQDLMTFIEEMLEPEIRVLAINFAYPLAPYFVNDKLDGRLIQEMKENKFEGLIGEAIGETTEAYIKEKLGRDIVVTVANDTICTLLSGLHQMSWEEAACGIVGTGMNFAFFLDNGQPVNLESANFDKFPLSPYGAIVDSQSSFPGKGLFEKEISGGYLYQHFNLYEQDHKENVHISSTKELDMFAQTCNGSGSCEFATELLDRSAAYVAAQIAAITKYKKRDMTFMMAGSLFWKGFNYKETVTKYVKELIPAYNVNFTSVESCEIYGAAKLAG